MAPDSPVVLVTGGSRGIGRACAILAAEMGMSVVVNYRADEAAARELVEAINTSGGRAIAVRADVGVEADIDALFAAVDGFGTLVGVVNNAGIVDRHARLEDMDLARIERMFRVNVFGAMLVARAAVKRMSKRHGGLGGAIVNISSMAAVLGGPNQYVDYGAAKGAIDTFTVGLAREVAAEGIRVNAVRPGIIATDIHASGGTPNRAAEMRPLIPMQREGAPDEVARAALWLLSDDASYVTGATLDVSGGR
jgi:NAD(P)-dependent dehydrogenase (short-subunit alcohol dehydrogenase family)